MRAKTGGQGGQDELHSENVCISWSKPSNYQEGLRCHAPENGRTNGGKWKIEQYSCRPETAVDLDMIFNTSLDMHHIQVAI